MQKFGQKTYGSIIPNALKWQGPRPANFCTQ